MLSQIKWVLATGFMALATWASAQTQSLEITAHNLPPEATMGDVLVLQFTVQNTGNANCQGFLKFYFHNPDLSETHLWSQAPGAVAYFLAPGQARNFNLSFNVDDQLFRLGGNTIVIWPSINGPEENTENQIERSIFIHGNNGSTSIETRLSENFTIGPNPASEFIQINWKGIKKPSIVEICDMQGKVVKALIPAIEESQIFSIADLPAGIYLIRVQESNQLGLHVQPLIIKK